MNYRKCEHCKGTGVTVDPKTGKEKLCTACNGSGRVIVSNI